MIAPPPTDRTHGWQIRRRLTGGIELHRLWMPSGILEPIRPDHYRIARKARFFDCGRSGPGTRQLALTILLGRFDWSVAWDLHEAFAAEFLVGLHLRPGRGLFIEKAEVAEWWAIKEDMVAKWAPVTDDEEVA